MDPCQVSPLRCSITLTGNTYMLEYTQLKCSKGLYAYFSQYNSTSILVYRQCIKHKATMNNERGQNHLHVYTISRFHTNIHFSYVSILTNQLCISAKALYNVWYNSWLSFHLYFTYEEHT